VGGFVFGRGDVPEFAVEASAVEPVDVLGDGDLDVVDAGPRSLVPDQFGLEEAVERLGQGVGVSRR
jgi:hypothetical protein